MFKRIRVPALETERLKLRQWTRKDCYDLFEYAQDPEVGPSAGWASHRDVGQSMAVIDNCYRKSMAWAIEEKETGKVVGSIMLDEDPYRKGNSIVSKEMGYSLAKSRWGRGYMPEAAGRILQYAFEILRAEVVTLRIAENNSKSQRVADKCGFTYEGTLRHSYRTYNGLIREVRCYSILASEYQNGKGEE